MERNRAAIIINFSDSNHAAILMSQVGKEGEGDLEQRMPKVGCDSLNTSDTTRETQPDELIKRKRAPS